MESQTSTNGLIVISKLYQEGKINDEDREKLKGTLYLLIVDRHGVQRRCYFDDIVLDPQ